MKIRQANKIARRMFEWPKCEHIPKYKLNTIARAGRQRQKSKIFKKVMENRGHWFHEIIKMVNQSNLELAC